MINRVTLLGRLGKKDYKKTKKGDMFCNLSISTNRKYIDSHGNVRELINWHHVYFFNKLAELTHKYGEIGELIYIEGEISNKKIDDHGEFKYIPIITGKEVKFISNYKKDVSDCSANTYGKISEQSEALSLDEEEDSIGF